MNPKWRPPLPGSKTWREHRRLMRVLSAAPQPAVPEDLRERLLGPLAQQKTAYRYPVRWQIALGTAVVAVFAVGLSLKWWMSAPADSVIHSSGPVVALKVPSIEPDEQIKESIVEPGVDKIKVSRSEDGGKVVAKLAKRKQETHPQLMAMGGPRVRLAKTNAQPSNTALLPMTITTNSEAIEGYAMVAVSGSMEESSVKSEHAVDANNRSSQRTQETTVSDQAGSYCKVTVQSSEEHHPPKGEKHP